MADERLRRVPSVHEVLESAALAAVRAEQPHELVAVCVRRELDALRERLRQGDAGEPESAEAVAARAAERVRREGRPRLRGVINATGIVLHTNLGRAPLAEAAARAAYEAGRGYSNLELDLETGKRSSRQALVRDWVVRLTGAESATAVNNNAAATVLVLRALCAGKEVVVSRGQLVEIGGSFRIPEIMAVSGATLREVGTTNITRLADYERAIGPNTGALMLVHCSNYRVRGFTEAVGVAELAKLGHACGVPVFDDVGSGALVDYARFGFTGEPLARRSLQEGADVVLFSGDKLLGGPQAGIVAGRKEFIEKIEKDPLMRAFRLDKMTLAALEASLRLYLEEEQALAEVPVLRMLGAAEGELRSRAEGLAERLAQVRGVEEARVARDKAFVGGGSLPDQAMPSWVVEVKAAEVPDEELGRRLRTGTPAVLGRLRGGRVVLDVRTVFAEQEEALVEAVRQAAAQQQAAAAPASSR